MTQNNKLLIRKVAVLGAGVMGAQIAAHLTNAGIKTFLFDLPAKEGDKNTIVLKALANLQKLKPSPLGNLQNAELIEAANYESDLEKLRECDLIIEAIAERMDWKQELYKKVTPYISDKALFVTNTSGLSINQLSENLPADLRKRFFGVHFFNPPRYMRLVEIIPSKNTDIKYLPQIETFLVSNLGKGVVYARDTVNFIANRVGVFSMIAIMHHALQFKIPFEVVDALTGTAIGRAKSATFRTADVVGLDTMAHVINTMHEHLQNDPWHAHYVAPEWLKELIKNGALGQKTQAGIFKKVGNDIHVFDVEAKSYRKADKKPSNEILEILKIKNPEEKFSALQISQNNEAKFLWACFRDLFAYAAFHLAEIADTVRDVDLALRWGFGWQLGVFELWQLANWQKISESIKEDCKQNLAMANISLPNWVNQIANGQVYIKEGAFSPSSNSFKPRTDLPVYHRQLFPEKVLAEQSNPGETLFENDGIRFWHQGDEIGIVSFKTKMNTINDAVLDGIQEAIKYSEEHLKGLIIWQNQGQDFSAGANLLEFGQVVQTKGIKAADDILKKFQETALALRYSLVPTIAAVRGRVLGGGCELMLHCARTVAAFETYIGLVEIGVGLMPAGGGTKEFAMRAANEGGDLGLQRVIPNYFKQIAMAEVSSSAIEAKNKNVLRETDIVVFHPDELLYVAKQQINSMNASVYRPPLARKFAIAGTTGKANLQMMLVNYLEGGFISEYDYFIATKIADVICGGDLAAGTQVDERWIMRLEREVFVELLQNEKTQARIKFMLENGKPLRN